MRIRVEIVATVSCFNFNSLFCLMIKEEIIDNVKSTDYLKTAPIGKLMIKFSIPCIISLLVSALYNIVDQIFIGHGVGMLGNGATNVVFPITIIALAVALLIGDGCAAYLSICQGRNDSDASHKSVGNAIIIAIAISIILVLFFSIFRDKILWAFGATVNNIEYAKEYFNYIIIGIPFFIFGNAINSIIRADGSPKFAMFSTFVGCIFNVILDPTAIFLLNWGMMGAALATIIGQIVTAILGIFYLRRTKSFKLNKNSFKLSFSVIKRFLPLGISSLLTQLSIVIIMCVMNNVLVFFGAQSKYGSDIPLTVMGIIMKVFQIVISICVGIAVGAQPIVGYNYGAGAFNRVLEVLRKMLIAEVILGIIAMIGFELFPIQIISIFGSEDALYNEFAVISFRIYLSGIILTCLQKSTSIFLQSLGKPVMSMVLSMLRDFILLVPLSLILPNLFELTGVLYSAPIADIVCFAVVLFLLFKINKDIKENKI